MYLNISPQKYYNINSNVLVSKKIILPLGNKQNILNKFGN